MKCPIKNEPEILLDYCAGRLAAGAAAEVREHIQTCEACGHFAAGQTAVWNALDAAPAPCISHDFDRKLRARIEQEQPCATWRPVFWTSLSWRPALGIALGCVLVIAAFILQTPRPVGYRQLQAADALDPDRIETALDDVDMLLHWAAATEEGRPM